MWTAFRDDDNVKHTFDLTKIWSCSYMNIVPPLSPHIVWLYCGRNDSELDLWPVEWRLISGWAFAQFLRLIRVLAVRMKKPLVLTYPSRNFAELLRDISHSFSAKCRGASPRFSANFRGENPRRNNSLLFFSAKKIYFAQGVFRGETPKKELFSWADL